MPDIQRLLRTLGLLLVALTSLSACDDKPAPSESAEQAAKDSPLEHARKHADPHYVCPMHPQIVRKNEGSCPICGMDLVLKLIDTNASAKPTVEISAAVIQSMGVRTADVQRDTLWRFIETIGRVEYDESHLVHVHPRTEGWMETLTLKAQGQAITQGQLIGQLYSPEVLAAQVDFLIALDGPKQRIEKARNRLRLLGVSNGTIERIQSRRKSQHTIPIYAPGKGIASDLSIRQGMYVSPSTKIVTIADLSRIWVIVDVFEQQIDWLQIGQSAEITVPAYPGRRWEGRVDYIYPELDPKSRTLKVRLAFDNPKSLLKANMFAEVAIYGGPKRDILVVPAEAIIETGERTAVVKALGDGRFKPVDIVAGMRQGDRVEILNGLQDGDRVVTSGQFLIDSESNLRASFARMQQ